MEKIINGRLKFEVTFNAIDVMVEEGYENDPDALFEAVIDNWCKGYSEQLGACINEYESNYREEYMNCMTCQLDDCKNCELSDDKNSTT